MTLPLRDYQRNGISGIRNAFISGAKSALYVLATGGGKTQVAGHIIHSSANKGKSSLLLAHRKELILQASRKLSEAGVRHGIIMPGFTPSGDPVQVGSVQTVARRLENMRQPDFIVIDEAHHCAAGQYSTILAAFPGARIIGITATPERLDGLGLGTEAAGPFDAMVLGPSPEELIREGYLTGARVFAHGASPDLKGVRSRGGDFDAGQVSNIMERPHVVGDAIQHYNQHAPGQPAILFSSSVRHAETMAAAFREAGWRAVAVSGNTDPNKRSTALEGLADGRVQVLCSCDIVSEGTDIPAVGCVILMRPTQSLGLYLQQVGRGLRPIYAPGHDLDTRDGRLAAIAASSKPALIVMDHAGNTLRHGMIEDEREWTLNGERPKPSAAPARQCPMCYAVHKPANTCPECGHSYIKAAEEKGGRKGPEAVDGQLTEVTPEAMAKAKEDKRRLIHGARTLDELRKVAKQLGYKRGWAEHRWGNRPRHSERERAS